MAYEKIAEDAWKCHRKELKLASKEEDLHPAEPQKHVVEDQGRDFFAAASSASGGPWNCRRKAPASSATGRAWECRRKASVSSASGGPWKCRRKATPSTHGPDGPWTQRIEEVFKKHKPMAANLFCFLLSLVGRLRDVCFEPAMADIQSQMQFVEQMLCLKPGRPRFVKYLIVRRMQMLLLPDFSMFGRASAALRHIGWGARCWAAKLSHIDAKLAQTVTEDVLWQGLAPMLTFAREIIDYHMPGGWSQLFTIVDLQHCCCEIRKLHSEAYHRLRRGGRSTAEYKQLAAFFAECVGLPLPTTQCATNATAGDDGDIDITPEQAAFLDFIESLVVRFCSMWKRGITPRRPGTVACLTSPAWKTKAIGQFCQLLDRSSLVFFQQVAKGQRDFQTHFLSVVISCTVGSHAEAAARLLPISVQDFEMDFHRKIMDCPPEQIRFTYPRALKGLKL